VDPPFADGQWATLRGKQSTRGVLGQCLCPRQFSCLYFRGTRRLDFWFYDHYYNLRAKLTP